MTHDLFNHVYGLVAAELDQACEKFPPFNSTQEGWAVIQEELDELRDTIRQHEPEARMMREAIQVAAMAFRFIIDLEHMERGR